MAQRSRTKHPNRSKHSRSSHRSRPSASSTPISPDASYYFMLIATVNALMVVVANLAAMKIWLLHSIPVDGGLIMFPITYVCGDLLVEIYGRRAADRVADVSFGIGLLTWLLLKVVTVLPDYPGADNSAFLAISSMANRIFIASLVGFVIGQHLNNYVFVRIRQHLPHSFLSRALGSSVPAHFVDVLVFETIAFYGRLPLSEFFTQALLAFPIGLVVEIFLYPITKLLAKRLKLRLHLSDGKPLTTPHKPKTANP